MCGAHHRKQRARRHTDRDRDGRAGRGERVAPAARAATAMSTATEDRPVIGSTIANKYRIESVIGEGGMGVVYEGTHEGTGGKVAVKMLRREAVGDQEHFDRFELEARVSSRIETGSGRPRLKTVLVPRLQPAP